MKLLCLKCLRCEERHCNCGLSSKTAIQRWYGTCNKCAEQPVPAPVKQLFEIELDRLNLLIRYHPAPDQWDWCRQIEQAASAIAAVAREFAHSPSSFEVSK